MTHLVLTIRWLDDRYHGKLGREGPAEWPPSPYRLFQALVAGAARYGELSGEVEKALAWLQGLDSPIILAPSARPGVISTRHVPNNDGDKKPRRQDRLTGKTVCPTLMLDEPEVHYVWQIDTASHDMANLVCTAAKRLTCLGWGVDLAYANGHLIDDDGFGSLRGVRWRPRDGVLRDEQMMRIPIDGDMPGQSTLCDLKRAHRSAVNRVEHGEPLNTVDRPKVYGQVFYESAERLLGRPYTVFELRNDDGSFFRYPQSKLIHIAGMMRHLAIEAMTDSPPQRISNADKWVDRYVAGHAREYKGEHRQFSYLPLPSIGHTHTDPAVRRVMIAAPVGDDHLLQHLAIRLAGQQLKPTSRTKLEQPPTLVRVRNDKVARFYTELASNWASVTPVILPGHDSHKPAKTRRLIEKALAQSGIDQPCEFEWSAFSRFPQMLSAHKYGRNKRLTGYIRPSYLNSKTAVHLVLRFNDELNVPGPLVIGAGRHCGLGLMAGIDQ
jgi:CRISPR-associated protein Csb2